MGFACTGLGRFRYAVVSAVMDRQSGAGCQSGRGLVSPSAARILNWELDSSRAIADAVAGDRRKGCERPFVDGQLTAADRSIGRGGGAIAAAFDNGRDRKVGRR